MRNKNPKMTFPIKKRISTELFIDRRATRWEPELSGKIEEGKMLAPIPTRVGMKNY